jgi:hypothetical protein
MAAPWMRAAAELCVGGEGAEDEVEGLLGEGKLFEAVDGFEAEGEGLGVVGGEGLEFGVEAAALLAFEGVEQALAGGDFEQLFRARGGQAGFLTGELLRR